jgi:hypothetical protein
MTGFYFKFCVKDDMLLFRSRLCCGIVGRGVKLCAVVRRVRFSVTASGKSPASTLSSLSVCTIFIDISSCRCFRLSGEERRTIHFD